MTPKSPTFRGKDLLEIKNAGALFGSFERTEPRGGFEANLISPHIRPGAGAAGARKRAAAPGRLTGKKFRAAARIRHLAASVILASFTCQAVAKPITELESSPHLDDKFRPWRAGRSP